MTTFALRRRLWTVVLLTVVTAAAACGTTVPLSEQGVPVAAGSEAMVLDDGLGMPAPGTTDGAATGGSVPGAAGGAGPTGGGQASGGTGAAPAGGGAPAGGSTASGTTSSAGSGGGGGGAAAGNAPGLTAETIKIGLEYSGDSSQANETIGANVSGGDPRANYEALIDYYNQRGGIAGRKIEPVYYEYSAMRDIAPQQQAACAHFTQDEPVFVVLVLVTTDNYANCLWKAGVGAIGEQPISGADDEMFARSPGYMMPSTLSLTQVARLYGPGMAQAGFFKPEAVDGSTKVGLLTFDEPRYRRAAERDFVAGMRSVGQNNPTIRYVHYAITQDQVGQMSAEVSAAVLAFRQAGIDHVMIIEENALIAFTFLNAAERQGYRPQYGFNSTSGGQILIDLGLAPPEQLTNARHLGWQPQFDVPRRFVDPWPAQQECLRMYEEAGIQFPDGNSRGIGLLSCASFGFLKAAVEAAPGPVVVDSIRAGAERLGTSWTSPWNKTTRFGPGRHYGAAMYLTAAYERGCNCFKPMGGMRRIP